MTVSHKIFVETVIRRVSDAARYLTLSTRRELPIASTLFQLSLTQIGICLETQKGSWVLRDGYLRQIQGTHLSMNNPALCAKRQRGYTIFRYIKSGKCIYTPLRLPRSSAPAKRSKIAYCSPTTLPTVRPARQRVGDCFFVLCTVRRRGWSRLGGPCSASPYLHMHSLAIVHPTADAASSTRL
jgi:hypothetical protein